jgi:uncharacterized protein (DUF2147 family)
MMTFGHLAGAAAAAALLLAGPAAAAPPSVAVSDAVEGLWRNGKDTVRIRTYVCGVSICGQIVRADAKARADAADGGTKQLVGTQVFREFRPASGGTWKGKVYVPDINRTFSGVLSLAAPDKLIGKGCVLGGLICKSSTWTRVR